MRCFKLRSVIFTFSVPGRPKHLLVLVNPLSGNFKGQEIYETVVAPVFKLAGIKTEVIGKLFLKRTFPQNVI